jgi:hypothetical protein
MLQKLFVSMLVGKGFVNIAPISDGDQNQLVLFNIEVVNDPEITGPHPEGIHALHSVMREAAQVASKLINFTLKGLLNSCWQTKKTPVKLRRVNLRGGPAWRIHGRRVR